MSISQEYKKPIIYAVLLHIVLLLVLILNFSPSLFRAPASVAPMGTVHATTVSEAAVAAEIRAVKKQPVETKSKPIEAQPHAEPKPKPIKVPPHTQAKSKPMEAQATAKLAVQKKLIKEQKLKQAHALAAMQKKLQAEELKQEKTQQAKAQTHALAAQQKKLQQQLMQQQLNSESKNISAVVSQAQQGVIDKYKAEILSVIQSNWHIAQVNSKLKCVYSVTLAPDGTVLSESLMKSSGDDALDQSAKQAIVLSSPLPVPTDPSTFNHFRQLVLTLSPQGYLQSASNS